MTDDLDRRVTVLEQGSLSREVFEARREAIDVRFDAIDRRLKQIEDNQTWTVRLIIGSLFGIAANFGVLVIQWLGK